MSAEEKVKPRTDVEFSTRMRRWLKRERFSVAVECKTFAVMGFKHPDIEEPECTQDCCVTIKGRFFYDPFTMKGGE